MPPEKECQDVCEQKEVRGSRASLDEALSSTKVYKEPRIQLLKNWDVTIKVLDVGCTIKVGCKNFAFSSIEEGIVELNKYYKDPHTARKKWEAKERELNKE